LKPGNVLLTADGTPKIGDFGLARLLDADGAMTAPDAILGTPNYMAPEQAEGRANEVGPAADVYALGAILYQALTGRPPFQGKTRMETLDQVRTVEPVAPARLRRGIHRDMEAICLKCLAKKPAQRYAAARELADDLGRWLRGEPTVARPMPWYARAWRQAPRRTIAAALLLLSCLAGAGLYLRFTAPPPPTDPNGSIQDIEDRLRGKKAVTLIGKTGQPAWSRWWIGEDASKTASAGDGAFVIHSRSCAVLELVRDPQVDRYVVRAEVRHDNGDMLSEVGLAIGMTAYPAGDDTLFFFVGASFDDINDVAKPPKDRPPGVVVSLPDANPVHLRPRLYAEGKPQPLWDEKIGGLSPALLKAAGANGGPWRSLTLLVTPEGIRGTWGEKDAIGELSAKALEENTRRALASMQARKAQGQFLKGINPRFNARGPLGLFVSKGSASFHNVVIEPAVETHPNP
jgi:serine/threonine-protein kinase